ncbi:MAG: hypothetical protein ABEL76_07265 [Bradymonadaceae bacterium]
MFRRWQIIDDDGRRDVFVDSESGDVRPGVKAQVDRDGGWPAFTQFVVRAPAGAVASSLHHVAATFDRRCTEVDPTELENGHVVVLAELSGLTLLTEPGIPFDSRFVTASSSEAIAESLGATGVHFGHDPAAGTLHLTRFEAGEPDFSWCDSLEPGPAFALDFHDDGRCTECDPRRFALDRLDKPADASSLNRTAFVTSELTALGLPTFDPEFEAIDPVAAYDLSSRARTRR